MVPELFYTNVPESLYINKIGTILPRVTWVVDHPGFLSMVATRGKWPTSKSVFAKADLPWAEHEGRLIVTLCWCGCCCCEGTCTITWLGWKFCIPLAGGTVGWKWGTTDIPPPPGSWLQSHSQNQHSAVLMHVLVWNRCYRNGLGKRKWHTGLRLKHFHHTCPSTYHKNKPQDMPLLRLDWLLTQS